MKILLYADCHVHGHKGGTINEDGVSSRIVDCVDAMKYAYEFAIAEGCTKAIFAGDMFHVRKNVDVAALNEVYKFFREWHDTSFETVLITGNHDQYNNSGSVHSLTCLSRYADVISYPQWIFFDKVAVMCTPFLSNSEDFIHHFKEHSESAVAKENKKVFAVIHQAFNESALDDAGTMKLETGISVSEIKTNFPIFAGHYHIPQQLSGSIFHIGALLAHDWRDADSPRGFIILDTDTMTFERYETNAPKFRIVEYTEGMKFKPYSNDFMKLIMSGANEELQKDIIRKCEKFNIKLEFIFPSQVPGEKNRDSCVNLSMTRNEILKNYAKEIEKETDFGSDELLQKLSECV